MSVKENIEVLDRINAEVQNAWCAIKRKLQSNENSKDFEKVDELLSMVHTQTQVLYEKKSYENQSKQNKKSPSFLQRLKKGEHISTLFYPISKKSASLIPKPLTRQRTEPNLKRNVQTKCADENESSTIEPELNTKKDENIKKSSPPIRNHDMPLVIQEYLNLTASTVKIKFSKRGGVYNKLDIDSEELIRIARDLNFFDMHEFMCEYVEEKRRMYEEDEIKEQLRMKGVLVKPETEQHWTLEDKVKLEDDLIKEMARLGVEPLKFRDEEEKRLEIEKMAIVIKLQKMEDGDGSGTETEHELLPTDIPSTHRYFSESEMSHYDFDARRESNMSAVSQYDLDHIQRHQNVGSPTPILMINDTPIASTNPQGRYFVSSESESDGALSDERVMWAGKNDIIDEMNRLKDEGKSE